METWLGPEHVGSTWHMENQEFSVAGTVLAVFGASAVVAIEGGASLALVNLGGIASARQTGTVTTGGEQLAAGLPVTKLGELIARVKGRSCTVMLFHGEMKEGMNLRDFPQKPVPGILLDTGAEGSDQIVIWNRISWITFDGEGVLKKTPAAVKRPAQPAPAPLPGRQSSAGVGGAVLARHAVLAG